ncbi:MAG TPA: EF-hand domain-containing protein [Gemmataceae bacterium]|jgi:Ca2+-binding EF-hand superfamily protein|nr:EF-hand domain-containing protein [Gemmataceae bacterium]
MLIKRWTVAVIAIGLLVIPMWAQYPSGDYGGGKRKSFGGPGGGMPGGMPGGYGGMPGGGGWDPNAMANMLFQGKDAVTANDVPEQFRGMFDRYVQRMGITDGRLTRAQFDAYQQQRAAQKGMMTNMTPGGGLTPGGPGGPGGPGATPPNPDSRAEDIFRMLDRDRDGVLSGNEIPDVLRQELEKWDANKNGVIELDEFKAWYVARMQARMFDRQLSQDQPIPNDEPGDEPDRKPTIYRKGKLPKELDWFERMDTDGDGQIGLYEWRKAGRKVKDFQEMDLNGDGFITVEEAMLYAKLHKPQGSGDDTALAGNFPGGMPGGNFPGAGFQRGAGMPGGNGAFNFNMGQFGPPGGMQPRGNWPGGPGPRGPRGSDSTDTSKGGDNSNIPPRDGTRTKGFSKKDRGN